MNDTKTVLVTVATFYSNWKYEPKIIPKLQTFFDQEKAISFRDKDEIIRFINPVDS